ncbi:MAG: phosphatase PAP2 family protein [Pseudomonadaceae bacterium]|nr:phosphatase PAP2 family protein [Pseudomonadaceae bacterium]
MLNSLHPAVKRLGTDVAILTLALGLLATLAWASGLDAALARWLYTPNAPWAEFLRAYGALAAGVVAWGCLAWLLAPRLQEAKPMMAQTALVIVLTAVFGAGLFNQVIVKDLADRPRPRDIVLADTPAPLPASFNGKSMPSGHAGMAFVLAAPYFVWRRRNRKVANAFLAGGLAFGCTVGLARMVVGAHFLSDVIVAALITLATARVAAGVAHRWQPIPRKLLLTLIILTMTAFLLGNRFTLTLTYEATQPWQRLKLPCLLQAVPSRQVANPVIAIRLTGYGAPVSQLKLVDDHGTVRLRDEFGLYHNLSCTGRLLLPAAASE